MRLAAGLIWTPIIVGTHHKNRLYRLVQCKTTAVVFGVILAFIAVSIVIGEKGRWLSAIYPPRFTKT